MYLDPASSLSPSICGVIDAEADSILKDRLWRQVRTAFPDLPGSAFRLEQTGGDHLILIVDEQRAFRFPRHGKQGLDLEKAVLERLGSCAQVTIPQYDLVDPEGCFASYLLIPGVPLTFARFSTLATVTSRSVIRDAVALLKDLHALDFRNIELPGAWPRMWSPGQFAERLRKDRLPTLFDRVPTLTVPVECFLRRYQHDQAPREVVLHGDLVSDHLLVDENTGCLTGIIDFSDVALGDPAHDLLGFWAFGTCAATQAVRIYGEADADPTLLARSRDHFTRYQIDRLFEAIAEGAGDDAIQKRSSALAALLADPHTIERHTQEKIMDDTAQHLKATDQRQRNSSTDAAGSVKQETMAAAGQAKRQASSLFEQAKDKVLTVASTQKNEIAGRIEELAQSVHKAGEPFAGQQEWIADAIQRGATELNTLASSLRGNDIASLVRQARTVAQRQPALFAGLCLAGGIAIARIGKLVAADVSREDLPSLPEVGHGAQ